MKHTGPVRLGCMVALLALLTAGCGSTGNASPQASGARNRIERAFVLLLADRHPGFSGSSKCPSKQPGRLTGGPPCVAEIHKGKEYVQVWAEPTSRNGEVAFKNVSTGSWTRHWSTYRRPPQHISPGLISVNAAGAYDWRWLLLGADGRCRQPHRDSCTIGGFDGQWGNWPPFSTFRCNVKGKLITCRNTLGDAVRWLPHAH